MAAVSGSKFVVDPVEVCEVGLLGEGFRIVFVDVVVLERKLVQFSSVKAEKVFKL